MSEPIRRLTEIDRDGQCLRIGDTVPLPRPKLEVRPASGADDPTASPRGVFRNGRGKP